ncbi:ketol-acid reductoisomerase [Chloroflexota bacterium]
MRIIRDQDANLGLLDNKTIAVIGYGNQGRSQALNLRDSGQNVIVGNQDDKYAGAARQDGFEVFLPEDAAAQADILFLLLPDEVMPLFFKECLAPQLIPGKMLVFASGFNIAFEFIRPPEGLDVVLVAPRMIGSGVRDLYVNGGGFPAFVGVAQDCSGNARAIALAIAKGIGATRMGVVDVTFSQEAELDLFTEQCFGPAFGQVLVSAVDLLIEQGYPPEAVLLELYMSGEFSYSLAKIAEMGLVEQSSLHSLTSQYGSISRGMRFMLPELRSKMADGLEEIRSGAFASEWAAEHDAGYPTLKSLRQAARSMPLYKMESELRQALGQPTALNPTQVWEQERNKRSESAQTHPQPHLEAGQGWISTLVRRLRERGKSSELDNSVLPPLSQDKLDAVLRKFLDACGDDPNLTEFAAGKNLIVHYVLFDAGQEFYMGFVDGIVSTAFGPPAQPANVSLLTDFVTLDGMFTGRLDAMRAAFSGKLKFEGDGKQAISIQRIQDDLCRLYRYAREK